MKMKASLAIIACMIICALMCGCVGTVFEQKEDSPRIIVGASKIEVRTQDNPVVGVQVDRVIRDYTWTDSDFDTKVPANRTPENSSQVVPYMEGARTRELMDWAGASVTPLTPCHAVLNNSDWNYYGSNGNNEYPFLILIDKVIYPTSEFFDNDTQVMIHDTHGFSAIAEKAYENRDKLDIAIACMDTESKATAALYLAENGINCYAPCDRFSYILMNYKNKTQAKAEIIGSAPIKKTDYGAVIGDQPVTIHLNEKIIVQYTVDDYPDQYCDTPKRYFTALEETFGLNLNTTYVYANIGETYMVAQKAIDEDAHVIGVRVYNQEDYSAVKIWLEENENNRAILFHSAAYEFGIKLFSEFPEQTSFGDLNPQVIY